MKKRLKNLLAILLATVMASSVLSIGVIPAAAAQIADANVGGDDYPYHVAPNVYYVDRWNFYQGECVSFCAWRLNNNNGVGFSNWYGGAHWGNGGHWDDAARSLGIRVDRTPAKGAIAYWDSGAYGHVAWVADVYDNGNVFLEEYNWTSAQCPNGDHQYHTRVLSQYAPSGFIHIKDIENKPVKPQNPGSINLNKLDLGKKDTLVASWGQVSGAETYNVRLICTTNSSFNQTKNNVSGTSVSFTINQTGSYYVAVSAGNSAGFSGETNSAYATVHDDLTVTWKDFDDTVIKSENVKYGGNAVAPAANPVREGYTFQGWDKSANNIVNHTTIKATYKINTYSVSFIDYNGDIIDGIQRIDYSSNAKPPTDIPTKKGYVFVGWNTDEYKCVKKNLSVKAVYEWENTDLPSILEVVSATRNEEATGYTVKVNLTNFPNDFTKGKMIVALKTKEGKMVASETRSISMPSEKEYSETVTILYSGIVSTVEVSMVGVLDDETTGTPKAKSVVAPIDIGNEWSNWSVNVPTGIDIITESRTEYRYKDSKTITATGQPATPSGYSFVSSRNKGTYTNWSGWSNWSTSWRGANNTTDVQTTTGYRFYAFVCPNCGQRDPYQGDCTKCGYYLTASHWQETYHTQSGPSISAGRWNNARGYAYINGVFWNYENPGYDNGAGGTGQPTTTMYRYRTRSEYIDYTYIQNSFSEWQPEPVTASNTRQVETRTTYRFKTNSTEVPCYNYKRYKYTNLNNNKEIYTYSSVYPDSMDYPGEWEYFKSFEELALYSVVDGNVELYNGIGEKSWYKADINTESDSTVYQTQSTLEDTSGVKRQVDGVLNNAPNKVVTLLVYKGQNTDPVASQIEYVGQTTTDQTGKYHFDFTTKEEPSLKTGDFVITIGAEGSTNYMVVGEIEAPKPIYTVDFITEEGTLISETNVVAGGSAEAPIPPEIEGFEFIGWDTALKNIQENTLIKAVYKKKTCVVVFADFDESFIGIKELPYGSEITADVIPEKVGKKFANWINSDNNDVYTVTENTVVTAKYIDATYIVTFFDADGNVISEQKVAYGNRAKVPEAVGAPSDNQVFAGWDSNGEEEYITKDLIVKPVFKYTEDSDAPNFTLASNTYSGTQKLGIYSLSANTKIYYYVADSSIEKGSGLFIEDYQFSEYKTPIVVDSSSVIIAFAETDGKNRSKYAKTIINIGNDGIGDANLDGTISIQDITAIQRHIAEINALSDIGLIYADADGNGVVDIKDATLLQMYLAEYGVNLGKQS